jgi:hypothetical protein
MLPNVEGSISALGFKRVVHDDSDQLLQLAILSQILQT